MPRLAFLIPLLLSAIAAAGPTISVVCDQQPKETGLTLSREGVAAASVDGKAAWVSRHKSVPQDEWARSFLLTVTDPRFKDGKMPAVDVEIVYRHEANTKVEVLADTARGGQVVGTGWGNKKEWQTLKFRLDDAHFGARKHNADAKVLPVDGFDLRINAWAGDFYLREVKITANDRTDPSDWTRFLSVEKVASTGRFIVEPGAKDTLTFSVRNRALKNANAVARWDLVQGASKVLKSTSDDVTLMQDGLTELEFPFDAAGLTIGEYAVRLALEVEGQRAVAYEQTVVVAGPEDLFIVFDKEPIARGIEMIIDHCEPKLVEVGGNRRWIWQADPGSQRGGDGWWKSFHLKITDDRFRNGGRPAVDIIVNYRHPADAPVQLMADTKSGSRQVGGGWGRNEGWQTLQTSIDDARFASTDYDNDPKKLLTDETDLRFNACVSDGQLRSLFIRGYPREQNADFARLLRFDGVDAGRDLFVFEPGSKQDLKLRLRNLALIPLDASVQIKLTDDFGKVLREKTQTNTVAADGPFELPVEFDTAGLKQGVYGIVLNIGRETNGARQELLKQEINVMVSDLQPLAKARKGEFLYGLDPGEGWDGGPNQDERWMKWYDFLGTDILRHTENNPDHLRSAMQWLEKHNLQTAMMFTPGYAAKQPDIDALVAKADAVTKEFGDRLTFYELGNEPDLTFFWNGSIEDYIPIHVRLYDTIKANDPDSVVMNGGLCFAGEEATRRALRMKELMPIDKIDAWAYHGHGPGVGAERAAWYRSYEAAKKFEKHNIPLVETESGLAASTPAQLRIQARTAIQKMVFAQSKQMPMFIWFRLKISGGDAAYTNVKNVHEPRPVVLSYRTMVKTLRHHRFEKLLDLGDKEIETYVFKQSDGPGRAIVAWSNGQGATTQVLKLSDKPDTVSDATLIDLFGNQTPAPIVAPGTVALPVSADPVFLTWKSADADLSIAHLPSALEVDPMIYVTPGATDEATAVVKNHGTAELTTTLVVSAGSSSGIKPTKPEIPVTVPPGGQTRVSIPLEVAEHSSAVAWPQRWTVFTGVPGDSVNPATFDAIPEQLEAAGKVIKPQIARPKEGVIDLAQLAGGYKERAEAICFAELTSDEARTIRIGAAADWWMGWYINGRLVYSTLDSGNHGPQTILAHTFDAPIKAGKNLIAVRVLSGSQGFKLTSGGPDELAAAQSAATGEGNAITMQLKGGDVVLATTTSKVVRRHVIAPLADIQWDGPASQWHSLEPQIDLGEPGIINEWAKQPDSAKWWKGEADLSARAWIRGDAEKLYVVVAAADDVHRPAGDGLILTLAAPGDEPVRIEADKSQVHRDERPAGGTTWYRLAVDRKSLPGDRVSVNLQINDDDFGGLKQSLYLARPTESGVPAASQWWQGVLRK